MSLSTGGFVLFSACQGMDANLDACDTRATIQHLNKLGIPSLTLLGCYRSKSETSIMVDECHFDIILDLARWLSQKSVLWVGTALEARLVDVRSGTETYIGDWEQVPSPAGKSYTTNQYSKKHYEVVK